MQETHFRVGGRGARQSFNSKFQVYSPAWYSNIFLFFLHFQMSSATAAAAAAGAPAGGGGGRRQELRVDLQRHPPQKPPSRRKRSAPAKMMQQQQQQQQQQQHSATGTGATAAADGDQWTASRIFEQVKRDLVSEIKVKNVGNEYRCTTATI